MVVSRGLQKDVGGGGVAGSQPMSTAVHRSPNKLWRSNSFFSLCLPDNRGQRERSGQGRGKGRETGRVSAYIISLGSSSIVSGRISQRRDRQEKKKGAKGGMGGTQVNISACVGYRRHDRCRCIVYV